MHREFNIVDFSKEKVKSYLIGLLIILIITIFLYYSINNFFVSLMISSFVGVVYFTKAYQWNKHYIKSLSISSGTLTLEYYRNGRFLSTEIDLEKLKIKKRLAIVSSGREAIMKISNNQGIVIYQYEIGDWSEEIMDEIIAEIEIFKKH